jgi:hypothetical protein
MALIDSDTDATDHRVVRFYVKEPGTCTIQIRNPGGAYNHYLLRTSD